MIPESNKKTSSCFGQYLTEQQVLDSLGLKIENDLVVLDEKSKNPHPAHVYLQQYLQAHRRTTDAHLGYGLQAALVGLAQAIPGDLTWGTEEPANLYAMSVGESTNSRKTTVWANIQNQLVKFLPEALMPQPGSHEALVDSLADGQPRALIYSEGASILSSTTREQYQHRLRGGFLEAYDGVRVSRNTVAKARERKGSMRFMETKPARLSIAIATTEGFLNEYTTEADYLGGLLGRFFMIHCRRERSYSAVKPIKGVWDNIGATLQSVRDDEDQRTPPTGTGSGPLLPIGQYGYCEGYDEEALKVIDEFAARKDAIRSRDDFPKMFSASLGRLDGIVQRLCLMFAHMDGRTRQEKYSITAELVELAVGIAELSVYSMYTLSKHIGQNKRSADLAKILTLLEERTSGVRPDEDLKWYSEANLLKQTKFIADRYYQGLLNTLVKMDAIVVHHTGSADFFRIKHEWEKADYSKSLPKRGAELSFPVEIIDLPKRVQNQTQVPPPQPAVPAPQPKPKDPNQPVLAGITVNPPPKLPLVGTQSRDDEWYGLRALAACEGIIPVDQVGQPKG